MRAGTQENAGRGTRAALQVGLSEFARSSCRPHVLSVPGGFLLDGEAKQPGHKQQGKQREGRGGEGEGGAHQPPPTSLTDAGGDATPGMNIPSFQ